MKYQNIFLKRSKINFTSSIGKWIISFDKLNFSLNHKIFETEPDEEHEKLNVMIQEMHRRQKYNLELGNALIAF
jgi:hypothetical protein